MSKNFGAERFETLIPTVLFVVDDCLAVRNPANVARSQRTKTKGRAMLRRRGENALYPIHGRDEVGATNRGHRLEHRRQHVALPRIERLEGSAAGMGQAG